jgi:hypothetical protein
VAVLLSTTAQVATIDDHLILTTIQSHQKKMFTKHELIVTIAYLLYSWTSVFECIHVWEQGMATGELAQTVQDLQHTLLENRQSLFDKHIDVQLRCNVCRCMAIMIPHCAIRCARPGQT